MKYKSLYVLSLSLIFAITGCAKDPGSATVTLGEYELKNNHTDFQQQLVDITDEDDIDFFLENHKLELSSFSNSGSVPTNFTWTDITDNGARAKSFDVVFSESSDFSNSMIYHNGQVYNLKIQTKYYYKVVAHYKTLSFESDVGTFTTGGSAPRNLFIEGVENCRDLGGYSVLNNKKIKQGMIYRTAQFNYDHAKDNPVVSEPTGAGRDMLVNVLKIKSEIDVREKVDKKGNDETAGLTTSSPLGSSVKYINLPMRFGGSNIFTESINRESIKQFFEYLAVADNYPIAFHCVRGTDRTGALAYALGALCGMNTVDLLKDYVFSDFANIGSMIKVGNISGMSFYPNQIDESEGDNISEKAKNYLINRIGVSRETLNAVIDLLVE